jgi:hypothetical protein
MYSAENLLRDLLEKMSETVKFFKTMVLMRHPAVKVFKRRPDGLTV